MKKKLFIILAFIMIMALMPSTVLGAIQQDYWPEENLLMEPDRYSAERPAVKPGETPEPSKELRGTYVVSWRQMISPESIDQVVQEAYDANFNALFVQVRARGDAYYNSSFVSRSEYLEGQAPDFDPLGYAIEKAHAKGIEVHAWLNAMTAWGTNAYAPKDPNHIFNAHPEWLLRDSTGKIAYPDPKTDPKNSVVEGPYFLAPGIPEVKDYLFDVYMEVVEKYDVDGIHFDFIRFPSRMGPNTAPVGYEEISLNRFREETGKEPIAYSEAWNQWRADQITEIVSRIYNGTKERKPDVDVSASVLAAWDLGLGRVFQDWRKWMELGILDFVVPMSYSTSNATVLKDTTDAMQVADPDKVVVGLGAHLLKNKPEKIAEQIEILRQLKVKGFILFAQDTECMAPTTNDYMQRVKELMFSKRVPVPDVPVNNFVIEDKYSVRNPLTVRVGEIDQWTREFSHRFFVRNGKTYLIVQNEGLQNLQIKVGPVGLTPYEINLDVKGEREVRLDISQYTNLENVNTAANHTFLLTVKAYGPPGGKAMVFIEDYYTK